MLDILNVTFPFFALVLCGFLAARWRLLPPQAVGGLNTFVLYFALPCMLYRFGVGTPVARLFDPWVMTVWLPCALVLVAAAVRMARALGIGWNDAAFGALVAAFPNTGFMGVPLVVALLGPAAAGPTIATVLIDMVVTTSLCVALSRVGQAGQHGAAAAARKALAGVALNPLPWAILAGGASSALGVAPLQPVMATLGLLADAASPVALFTIGAVLARPPDVHAGVPGRGNRQGRAHALAMAVAKLLAHPLLVMAAGRAAMALGWGIDAATVTTLVLVAALPSASNVAFLAQRYGADTGRIARIILLTTSLAFLSFSGAVALLR